MRKVSIPRKFNKFLKEEAAHYRKALQLPDNNPAKRDIIHPPARLRCAAVAAVSARPAVRVQLHVARGAAAVAGCWPRGRGA